MNRFSAIRRDSKQRNETFASGGAPRERGPQGKRNGAKASGPPPPLIWTGHLSEDFTGLGLSDKVQQAVAAAGYTRPTDIQAKAIPHVLTGQDLIGIAQTGTGKTASFVLPMLTRLEKGRARARMPRTLILEPTRELAAQVHENFVKYGINHKLSVALLIGGVSMDDQIKKLDRGTDVLIATPGRLLDLFERGRILLTGVEILVVDEADRMLDMGFIPDVEKICTLLPPRRQTLFFSATMAPEIEKLTKRFLRDPTRVEVSPQHATAENIEQWLMHCGSKPAEKRAALRARVNAAENLTNAIIFCNRKRDVATLERSLSRHGFDAGALHGDMDQKARTETLDKFRSGGLALLVASDVAARGLDIPAVSHVFNFDVPTHAEDYIHRIGRTGRAGRAGVSVTLVTREDAKHLDAIIKLIKRDIPYIEGDAAPVQKPAAKPAETEARPDKPSRRSRKPRGSDRSAPAEKPQESAAPRESKRDDAPARKPEKPNRKKTSTGPFDDGQVPAFLLRSAARPD